MNFQTKITFSHSFLRSIKDTAGILEETSKNGQDGPMAKKHAGDKNVLDKKKKEKKKVLKRL